jgi:DNA-binding IclR family transcriptional regulator
MDTNVPLRARNESKGIKSVEVGYRVLLAVQRGPGGVSLSDIAKGANLSTGAAHNYLSSLVRTGMVEQESRGVYRLGPSAFALSLTSFRQLNGYEILKTEAQTLHELTNQSTGVTVWSQGGPVSIFTQRSDNLGIVLFRPGLVPILDTGAGALFSAYLADELTSELINAALVEEGRSSETAKDVIVAARREVLAQGWVHRYRPDSDSHVIAAPVWTLDDRIAFVLSLLSRDDRADPKAKNSFVPFVVEGASRASMLLGGTSATGPQSRYRYSMTG